MKVYFFKKILVLLYYYCRGAKLSLNKIWSLLLLNLLEGCRYDDTRDQESCYEKCVSWVTAPHKMINKSYIENLHTTTRNFQNEMKAKHNTTYFLDWEKKKLYFYSACFMTIYWESHID